MTAAENETLETRKVCCTCIGDDYLQEIIVKAAKRDRCHYCYEKKPTLPLETIAKLTLKAINDHFVKTPSEPDGSEYTYNKELGIEWYREGQPINDFLQELLEIEHDISKDILNVLKNMTDDFERAQMGEEQPFDGDAHYDSSTVASTELSQAWREFEKSIKYENRFFNPIGVELLSEVFNGLEHLRTKDNFPVVVDLGPNTAIPSVYRARVFQSKDKLKSALENPHLELGPPPPQAAISGRMNSRGISIFYSAINANTALNEVRPPVGSDVMIGKFAILHPLKVLDLEKIKNIYAHGSVFDTEYLGKLKRARFLNELSNKLTSPVLPESESFDYLVTQAISDYLAVYKELSIDGIMYRSSQTNGEPQQDAVNIALFHKAAKVAIPDFPKGTIFLPSIYGYDEEGRRDSYSIIIESSEAVTEPHDGNADMQLAELPFEPSFREYQDFDKRLPTLDIDLKSLQIHSVLAVSIVTDMEEVAVYEVVKSPEMF